MMEVILSDLEYRKTKWRLRRGLLELDILLENFAEESLRHLRYEEMYELNQCLDLSDNDFLELIIKKKSAEKLFGSSNEALQSLLNKIRNQVEVKECND
jgi:antitoxin CptB